MNELYWDEHGIGRCPECDFDAQFTLADRVQQAAEFGENVREHMCAECGHVAPVVVNSSYTETVDDGFVDGWHGKRPAQERHPAYVSGYQAGREARLGTAV